MRAGSAHPEPRSRAAAVLKKACEERRGSSCVDVLALALADVPWLRVLELGGATQDLKGKEIVLLGRPFVIERWAARLDASGRGPEAWSFTACFTAPDGVRICLDAEGPLDSLKTTLRGSPALSESALLAKLLLDDATGSTPSSASCDGT